MTWSGDVDLASVAPERHALDAVLDDPGTESIVLDLGAVTFFDCAALSVLLQARRRAEAGAVAFDVRRVPASVAKVLRITGTGTTLGLDA